MRGSCLEIQTENDDETIKCVWMCACVQPQGLLAVSDGCVSAACKVTSDSRWSSFFASASLLWPLVFISLHFKISFPSFFFISLCVHSSSFLVFLFSVLPPSSRLFLVWVGSSSPRYISNREVGEGDERENLPITIGCLFTQSPHKHRIVSVNKVIKMNNYMEQWQTEDRESMQNMTKKRWLKIGTIIISCKDVNKRL